MIYSLDFRHAGWKSSGSMASFTRRPTIVLGVRNDLVVFSQIAFVIGCGRSLFLRGRSLGWSRRWIPSGAWPRRRLSSFFCWSSRGMLSRSTLSATGTFSAGGFLQSPWVRRNGGGGCLSCPWGFSRRNTTAWSSVGVFHIQVFLATLGLWPESRANTKKHNEKDG